MDGTPRPEPPTLALDGGRLRPLRATDADELFAYLSQPIVIERTSYPDVTPALIHTIIERSHERWIAGELAKWAVTLSDDDRPIGTCGFNQHVPAHRWAEVAFDLSPDHWGRGLMRRALLGALGWAFEHQHIDRAQAFVRVDNPSSFGLLERCGFQREGRLRNYRICRGQPHDFFVYALLRSEWVHDAEA